MWRWSNCDIDLSGIRVRRAWRDQWVVDDILPKGFGVVECLEYRVAVTVRAISFAVPYLSSGPSGAYHVLPNWSQSQVSFLRFILGHGEGLTFSRPKNLSLPSGLSGPALSSILSSGVNSGSGSSFFCFGDALLSVLDPPWKHGAVRIASPQRGNQWGALQAVPKTGGEHTIPEPFKMRNMASVFLQLERGGKAALGHSPVWLPRARYGAMQMSGWRTTARYLPVVTVKFRGRGSLSTRCLGGNGWQQPSRPGSSAAQWASRANRGSSSVAGCRRRGLRFSSSRVRIGWRTAETVSLSCVDGLVRTWRAWKARSGRGQGVSSRSRMVGKVDRIPYPVEDPGSWAPQASAGESRAEFPVLQQKFKVAKKRKRCQVGLCRDRSLAQPLLAKKTGSLVWSWSWNLQIRSGYQMAIFPISVPLGRRSPLVDPATTPRPSEQPVTRSPAPSTMDFLRRRQGVGGPMRSPRGEVFLQSRASRGEQLSSRTWNLEAWPHPPSCMRWCTTENRADGCNDGWALRSSQVSFVAAQRQTLAEPPEAIHFQDIQLQHGLPAARRGSVLSRARGYLSDPESVVAISGPRFQGLEAGACVRMEVKSHGPRGRRSSPPSARRPLEPRCPRNLSSMCGSGHWCGQRRSLG